MLPNPCGYSSQARLNHITAKLKPCFYWYHADSDQPQKSQTESQTVNLSLKEQNLLSNIKTEKT